MENLPTEVIGGDSYLKFKYYFWKINAVYDSATYLGNYTTHIIVLFLQVSLLIIIVIMHEDNQTNYI